MATFTNQASLTYNNITTNSNVAVGELLEVLSASKTAITPFYTRGADITYAISILNSGAAEISGVTVTDDLGAYPFGTETRNPLLYRTGSIRLFVNGILAPAPTVTSEDPLTVTGITIPAGGNAILLYEAVATEFAPPTAEGTVVNTAAVTGNGVTTPVTATETVSSLNTASLAITKTISPNVVTENSRVTYTFVIQNFGNQATVPEGGATVTDVFSPILANLSVALNGNALSEGGDYTYDETTGLFATVPGIISVPAATFTQNSETGVWETTPGSVILTVTGTI